MRCRVIAVSLKSENPFVVIFQLTYDCVVECEDNHLRHTGRLARGITNGRRGSAHTTKAVRFRAQCGIAGWCKVRVFVKTAHNLVTPVRAVIISITELGFGDACSAGARKVSRTAERFDGV